MAVGARYLRWKRGWIGHADHGWLVSGEFAKVGVPLDTAAFCPLHNAPAPDPGNDCVHGFSAYKTKLEALRRNRRASSILSVELEDSIQPGPHVIGAAQRVLEVHVPQLCRSCLDSPIGVIAQTNPWPGGLEPVCAKHATQEVMTLDAVAYSAGCPVLWTSGDHGRWLAHAREAQQLPLRRCVCGRINHLRENRGLKYYFDELWVLIGFIDDGTIATRCRVCGSRWLYYRKRDPACAEFIAVAHPVADCLLGHRSPVTMP